MQTSKYFLAAGVLAATILPLQVQGGPDSEEQAKMRAALRRALEQPNTQSPQATPAVAPAEPAPAPAAQPQPAPVTPVAPPPVTPTVVTFEAVPPPDDAASIARARELMRQKMQGLQTSPAPTQATTVSPAPVAAVAPPPAPKPAQTSEPALVKPAQAAFAASYKPIDAPASPFSPSKQAKLNDLLARYRADSITAQEYHAQRAAIIAEP